mmetsp:Transcript_76346/g.237199  ORF Transcript_76346/g.237199 Transcript_76346/m.237199 type:complete len:200 (-) Transcript_76346:73-672(-)
MPLAQAGPQSAAEAAAAARGARCACIDLDMNKLCSRISAAVVPSPCNLGRALLAWLAFPRVVCGILFPGRGGVDVLGCTVLHAASFRLRTWAAFVLAGLCAGCLVAGLLLLFGSGIAGAAEGSGVVSRKDREAVQGWVMLVLEFYLLARLYDAVATARDEAMYRGVVAKAREHSARRVVVVVGAAHANGILRRVAERGL